jgi:hypothetical protein
MGTSFGSLTLRRAEGDATVTGCSLGSKTLRSAAGDPGVATMRCTGLGEAADTDIRGLGDERALLAACEVTEMGVTEGVGVTGSSTDDDLLALEIRFFRAM